MNKVKHSILLKEDNIAYRRSKTDLLEDEGFSVRAVGGTIFLDEI